MRKWAVLLALLTALSGCAEPATVFVSSEPASSASGSVSLPERSSASESVAEPSAAPSQAASEKAAAEKAAAEQTAAEKAAAEQAAAEKAAAEKAAAEKAAAEKAAAEQAAAEKAAAEQAAAEKAAAEQAAAEKAAAEQAAAEKAAAEKNADKSGVKPVTGTNYLSRVEEQIISLINEERSANGLNELEYHVDLRSAARIRSRELYRNDMFAHTRPNGDSWVTVLQEDIPLSFSMAGENLCTTEYNDPSANYARDADFWFTEWVNSEPHYENIIKPEYTHVGVGVYCVEKDGFVYAYAATMFARF